jgi:hypothetical protein
MIFLDGREFTGDPPGLRTIQRGPLMLVYLTDVRGERVVIIHALEQHGVDVQEVAGNDAVCLGGQELPPGR